MLAVVNRIEHDAFTTVVTKVLCCLSVSPSLAPMHVSGTCDWILPMHTTCFTIFTYQSNNMFTICYITGSVWVHLLSAVVTGLLIWPIIEYATHRWLFHLKPPDSIPFLIAIHFCLHGLHHKVRCIELTVFICLLEEKTPFNTLSNDMTPTNGLKG